MTGSTDAPSDGLLEVGRILKSHGLRGEVVVDMTSDRPERVTRGAELATATGPLVVMEARPHQDRWLIRFDGCTSREAADALRGTVLWAEPLDDEDELWVHELIGCTVVDAEGIERGTVESVQDNGPSPDYFPGVRRLCDEHGAVFILDEIKTGFRFGLEGAGPRFGAEPDLATFGKAMCNGYPAAVVVGKRSILEKRTDTHMAATFHGDLLSMAATLPGSRTHTARVIG